MGSDIGNLNIDVFICVQFITLCFFAVVAAAPKQLKVNDSTADVEIVRYENENIGLGHFRFAFEQTDGTKQEQQGSLENEGTPEESIAVQGFYGWLGPDGVPYLIKYTADDQGFKPMIYQGPGGAVPSALVASVG